MAYRIDKRQAQPFEPGCLYIVASLPRRLPYASHNIAGYATVIPSDIDLGSYETEAATGRTVEQFEWSVYYHESTHGGTWYRLVKDLSDYHHGPCPNPKPPVYTLERTKLRGGALRLQEDIVAIFAVLYLPTDQAILTFKKKSKDDISSASSTSSSDETDETSSTAAKPATTTVTLDKEGEKETVLFKIPLYLDWLTARTASRASRTFIWAVSVFLRCRIHLASYVDTGDNIKTFDIREFLGEALAACYPEVLMASRPVLPRPVFLSGSSVHMIGSLGDDADGSPVIVAVDSVHVCQPHPELDQHSFESSWSSSTSTSSAGFSPASSFLSAATARYQCPVVVGYGGESLYGSAESQPDLFVWPTMWLSPKKMHPCFDDLLFTTTKLGTKPGKEGCDNESGPRLAQTEAGRARRPRVQSMTTYNDEFPPLPSFSAKGGE